MLKEEMMQEILNLKANGFTVGEVRAKLAEGGAKAPSLPTVRKYYNMDVVPQDPSASLAKPKAFDIEPFRSAIVQIIESNPKCQISSVCDVLIERFVESGQHESLPGNEQTLRNYVRFLKASGAVDAGEGRRRTYEHVFDTPPAQQCLIDFGELEIAKGIRVFFIALLLRFSRLLGVYAQDHRFDGVEACRATYRFFTKIGGRPEELVIDQDTVFVNDEKLGEVVLTKTFEDFTSEQGLRLWVCNKHDPESKGGVENLVGFVKKNYFSARTLRCIEEVGRTLPAWCERKNRRIHQATYLVPFDVFEETEKAALRPLLPSVHEAAPIGLKGTDVGSMPYIQYASCKYSVPGELCFKTVYYRAIGDRLHIYGPDRRHVCTHGINPVKGQFNQLPEHKKEPSAEWLATVERLRARWNCYDFQHLVNGFKKENPRHLAAQLKALEDFLDAERPDRALVARVMGECCKSFRYRFSQFKAVFELEKARLATPKAIELSDVQKAELSCYQEAFDLRCAR